MSSHGRKKHLGFCFRCMGCKLLEAVRLQGALQDVLPDDVLQPYTDNRRHLCRVCWRSFAAGCWKQ